ncbi:hypothetical protein NC651_021510 [Populus alba x Populus x berolinensis]|nr:hypothetical protein NC651_021510 [Populus alba x Populus x berolinensis]
MEELGFCLGLSRAQPESPLVMPAKANSSITESNSLSDTYNHQSHGSSAVDSLLDAVSSPDFSSINMADSCHMGFVDKTLVQDYNGSIPTGLVAPAMAKIDPADDVIDKFAKGRVLPQKGKLLQAVMDTGPLLQTLLLAVRFRGGEIHLHCSRSIFHLFLLLVKLQTSLPIQAV